MRARPDLPSLVAGIAITVFGVVLLIDTRGGLDLAFSGLAPLACAVIGSILVAAGLSRRD